VPKEPPHQSSDPNTHPCSLTTLWRGTEIPLYIHTIGSKHPTAKTPLIDLGATGNFIDINYVRSKNLCTHIPSSIPVYNVDGTLNDAGYITKVLNLLVQYGDHSEQATFHVTGIGRMTIILRHTWLIEHNPKIDWSTGKVCMNRCWADVHPTSPQTTPTNQVSSSAENSADHLADNSASPKSEVVSEGAHQGGPEGQTEPNKTRPPPGFACPDQIDLDQGNRLFICFIGEHSRSGQGHSDDIPEAHGSCRRDPIHGFEDIVPKPYQEFKDVFAKKSFNELLDWNKWDHAIELVPDAQMFSTKVYLLVPVEQKQLDEFLEENLQEPMYMSIQITCGLPCLLH